METPDNLNPTVRADAKQYAGVSAAPGLPNVAGYVVLELVGRGGMGRVYRARHLGLGRVVALKLLAQDADENLLARFREETRAVAHLQHPNIAQLYETGSLDGRPYFAQEFLDGGSLFQALAGRPRPPRDGAGLLEIVARAVHHSHTHGILHRDLKPGNILLARKSESEDAGNDSPADRPLSDFIPKVADFGLAKVLGAGGTDTKPDSGGALTRTGEILGTPSYMPPEQASGAASGIGPAADVYALGAVLYELLTGRPPFQSPDPVQTLMLVLTRDPVAPRALQPAVPRDLETICLKCLEKAPRKRYESARDLADDLRRFLDGRPIVARPVGPVELAGKWARRNKAVAALVAVSAAAGVLLLAAGAALGVGYIRLKHANDDLATKNSLLDRANRDLTAEKQKTEQEKDKAEQTLAVTLVTLDSLFFDFSDRLKDVPRAERVRLDVLGQARRTLDGLHEFLPDDPKIQNYRMTGYDRLGNSESAIGLTAETEVSYTKARDIATALEARYPDTPLYATNRILVVTKIAVLRGRRGDYKSADALLDGVVPAMDRLAVARPNDPKVLELATAVGAQLLHREMRRGRWDAVETRMRELRDLNHRLAAMEPDAPVRKRNAIDADRQLAEFLLSADKLDEAGVILRRAAADADALPDSSAVSVRKLRAATQATFGDYYVARVQDSEAIAAYSAAATEYAALTGDFPNAPVYRFKRASVLYTMVVPVARSGDTQAAVKHLEEAEKLLIDLTREHANDSTYSDLSNRVSNLLNKIRPPSKPPDKKP